MVTYLHWNTANLNPRAGAHSSGCVVLPGAYSSSLAQQHTGRALTSNERMVWSDIFKTPTASSTLPHLKVVHLTLLGSGFGDWCI